MTTENTLSPILAAELTTSIVVSVVGKQEIGWMNVPALIGDVHAAVLGMGAKATVKDMVPEPAVAVRASIKPDYIVCLEDGAKLKMLKRYLRTHFNMTPDEYRAKWNLPRDYPMVAPNYAEQRRSLAKQIGLGRKVETKPSRRAA